MRRQAMAGEHVGVEAGCCRRCGMRSGVPLPSASSVPMRPFSAIRSMRRACTRASASLARRSPAVSQRHPVHAGTADPADVQVAHHLVEVDRAAGGVGMDHAAFELADAQGLLRQAFRASCCRCRCRPTARSCARRRSRSRCPATDGSSVATEVVPLLVVQATGEQHVCRPSRWRCGRCRSRCTRSGSGGRRERCR